MVLALLTSIYKLYIYGDSHLWYHDQKRGVLVESLLLFKAKKTQSINSPSAEITTSTIYLPKIIISA
jgi:hypothetical protein